MWSEEDPGLAASVGDQFEDTYALPVHVEVQVILMGCHWVHSLISHREKSRFEEEVVWWRVMWGFVSSCLRLAALCQGTSLGGLLQTRLGC